MLSRSKKGLLKSTKTTGYSAENMWLNRKKHFQKRRIIDKALKEHPVPTLRSLFLANIEISKQSPLIHFNNTNALTQ